MNNNKTTTISTNTATLVIYDLGLLKHRLNDDCDWWSIPEEELEEVNKGNCLFIGTGSDGTFDIHINHEQISNKTNKIDAFLKNKSGRFMLCSGEYITGDGLEPSLEYGNIFYDCPPGNYKISAIMKNSTTVLISVEKHNDFISNKFTQSPSLVHNTNTFSYVSSENVSNEIVLPEDLINSLGNRIDTLQVRKIIDIIAPDSTSSDKNVTFIYSSHKGIALIFENDILNYIHLFQECEMTRTHPSFKTYPYNLPLELKFGTAQEEIISKLGQPDKGTGLHWGIYKTEDYALRVGFKDAELVSLNLLSLDSELAN